MSIEIEEITNKFEELSLTEIDDSGWEYLLGNVYYKNKQFKEAIESLLKATELNSNDADNLYWLGNSYIDLKDYNKAAESYEKGIEINSTNCDILNNYGLALANLNRIEEAKKYFEKALEIDSDYKLAKDNIDSLNSFDIDSLRISEK